MSNKFNFDIGRPKPLGWVGGVRCLGQSPKKSFLGSFPKSGQCMWCSQTFCAAVLNAKYVTKRKPKIIENHTKIHI